MIDFSVVLTWGENKPIEELNRLIDQRIRQMGDSAKDALFAAAHTIIRSLLPLVRVAKVNKTTLEKSYDLTDTGLIMGQQSEGNGKRKYRPHHHFQADYRKDIRPICLWGGGIAREICPVFKVTPRYGAGRKTWAKNLHKGCWYIAAYSEATARKYAENVLMKRAIKKFAGLARASVLMMRKAVAMAGGDPMPAGERVADFQYVVKEIAYANVQSAGDQHSLEVTNKLSYARSALQDRNALEYAIAKAANSISGYLRSKAVDVLDPAIATPFPEIARGGSMR